MNGLLIEMLARWAGGIAALLVLISLLQGIWRGRQRLRRRHQDRASKALLSPFFYLLTSLGCLVAGVLLWQPLPFIPAGADYYSLRVFGGLLYFTGLALVAWGRWTLGQDYFVSTTFGAVLLEGQKLVTLGPYAWVRHPLFLGVLLTGLGGLLFYRTWTFVLVVLTFPALIARARREEQALAAEFGSDWLEYCRRTPAWLPGWIRLKKTPLPARVLLEIGLLFLPSLPAYLWLWPNVEGQSAWIAETVSYLYILAGTLFIGLRRWGRHALGLNASGVRLSLISGLGLLLGRQMIIASIQWGPPPSYSRLQLAGLVFFYLFLVGLGEELLFRGLLYHTLRVWRRESWAIWGSSFGFLLWHVFGQGPVIGLTSFVIGLVFALFRWRSGGILGLVLIHGLWDLQSVLQIAEPNIQALQMGREAVLHPHRLYAGTLIMLAVPLYLWLVHPRMQNKNKRAVPNL